MNYGLTDKVVVIAGANAGVGLEIARLFADENAAVVGGDLENNALEDLACHYSVLPVCVDLATPEGATTLIQQAINEFEMIDVLVNIVEIIPMREGFLSVTDTEWQRVLNLTAVLKWMEHSNSSE